MRLESHVNTHLPCGLGGLFPLSWEGGRLDAPEVSPPGQDEEAVPVDTLGDDLEAALKDILGGESFAAFQNWGERRTARARQKARARKETRDLRRKLRTAAAAVVREARERAAADAREARQQAAAEAREAAAAVVRARQQAAAEAREACQRVQRVALENIVEFFGLAPDAATPKNIYTKLCERGNTDRLNDIFPCIGMEVPPWYSLHPNDLRAKIMKHIGMNHQPDGEERNALWQTVSQAKIRRRRDEKEERRVKEQRRRTVIATTVRENVIDFLKVTDVNGDADDIPTLDAIADAFWRLDEPNRIECYVDKAGLTGKTGLRYDKDMKPPKGKGLGSVANMLVHCGATEEKAKEVASEAYKRVVMAKIERKDRTQYR